ncbi:MAG: YbaK/EbsC family protein [Promethearchaeota archaeon]
MNTTSAKIIQILDKSQVDYTLYEHTPVYTCEQAAKIRGIPLSEGIKALLIKVNKRGFILVLTRADQRLNLKKIRQIEGGKKIRFARPEEVKDIAGCDVGCVHPFINVKTYVDRILVETPHIEFNPARHDQTIRLNTKDLLSLLKSPIYHDISL